MSPIADPHVCKPLECPGACPSHAVSGVRARSSREYSLSVEWIREGEILPPGVSCEPDSLIAMRPWVLEAEGALRMWYSGHDGTTWRILRGGSAYWRRVGTAWGGHRRGIRR